MRAIRCMLTEPYQFGHLVECIRGKQYFDGELRFPGHTMPPSDHTVANRGDGTYKSVFGPCFDHTGVIYCNCNHCFRLGSRRLLAAIKNNPLLALVLQRNQTEFVASHWEAFKRYKEEILSTWPDIADYRTNARLHHDDPHQKRLLRILAWKEGALDGTAETETWLRNDQLEYKMKKGEVAKNGKKPRGIGDLGVLASLMGFYFTKCLKNSTAKAEFEHRGVQFVFCPKPSTTALRDVFENLYTPERRGYFVCFSDDACLALRLPNGGFFRANLDISSCDSSHTNAIFALFRYLSPDKECADGLLRQCRAPFSIRSIDENGKKGREKCVFRPKKHMLYSGSTITTVLNVYANFLIFLAIAELPPALATPQLMKRAAARAGYIITVDEAKRFEHIQFLKHSPALDTRGRWQPLLNFGVLLRSSGRCNGDIPGRGTYRERAAYFQQSLLRGMYPRVQTPFIDRMKNLDRPSNLTLKSKDAIDRSISSLLQYKVECDDDEVLHFTTVAAFRRYSGKTDGPNLDHSDIEQLLSFSSDCGFGDHFAAPASAAILHADYELTTPDFFR